MKTSDFYYDLPKELIAQDPLTDRAASRMLVMERESGAVSDHLFREIGHFLHKGDVLVLNDTKVIPARLFGVKEETGAVIEILLLTRRSADDWEVLVKPSRKVKEGTRLAFGYGKLYGTILEKMTEGRHIVRFSFDGIFEEILDSLGEMPLPPYIHHKLEDKTRYQTVYAREEGSAAAPTAGLHFTKEILEQLRGQGVEIVYVTLHVGLGTFRPVKEEEITDHVMHSEFYIISPETAAAINLAKEEGRRVLCVGTTSCRTVESAACEGRVTAQSGWTDIFIYPGYRFQIMDGLLTNFHLPESTLVMLVSAFAGRENILRAYKHAVDERYRFFSFGDAMLIE